MIIISSRKFRDSQQEYFRKALTEDVILTTVHFGSFKLVPIIEGEPRQVQEKVEVKKESVEKIVKTVEEEVIEKVTEPVITSQAATDDSKADTMSDGIEIVAEDKPDVTPPSKPVETPHSSSNVYVDPALYDAYPEQYAKELEEERRMVEDLQTTGLKRLFKKIKGKI